MTSSLEFDLGGNCQGATIGLTASEGITSRVTDAEINGEYGYADTPHWQYLFPQPPGENLLQYAPNRYAVWWKSDTSRGRQTEEPVGNGGNALFEWWNSNGTNDGTHRFYTFSILMACESGLCGKGVSDGP